jgi:hypothetical protein
VFSVQSRDTLWVVADRRLSYKGRPPKDDAVKVVSLETDDGIGVLAYAGLGATRSGTQPSDWMNAVLRGRGGLTFEQTLGALAGVATKELPRHLAAIPNPSYRSHVVIAPAFIKGIGSRLYTIDYVIDPGTGRHRGSYRSHVRGDVPGSQSIRIAGAGSGAGYTSKKGEAWHRALRRLVRDHDLGKVSNDTIADQLAALNYEVHEELAKRGDDSVGPRSIVVWRRRRDARKRNMGDGQLFYTGTGRDQHMPGIPTIINGNDLMALVGVFTEMVNRQVIGVDFDSIEINLDTDEMNRRLASLPDTPDDKLR